MALSMNIEPYKYQNRAAMLITDDRPVHAEPSTPKVGQTITPNAPATKPLEERNISLADTCGYLGASIAAILGIVVAVFGIALLSPGAIAVGALLAVGGSAYIPYRCCSSKPAK